MPSTLDSLGFSGLGAPAPQAPAQPRAEAAPDSAPAPIAQGDLGGFSGLSAPTAVASDSTPTMANPSPDGFNYGAGAPDAQRHATVLENLMNTLGTTNYISAGAVDALLHGQNPIEGAAHGVLEHKTYGDVLNEAGVTNPWVRMPLGLALDVALDPLTYTGFGSLTKAGEAAKAATIASKAAELGVGLSDTERAAQAAAAASRLAQTGELGTSLAEQGARGQRAAVSFAGQSILPEPLNQALLGAMDKVGGAIGGTQAAQALRKMFLVAPELSGVDRDVFLANAARPRAAEETAMRDFSERNSGLHSNIVDIAKAHGVEARPLYRALFNASELATPSIETPLTSATEQEFFGKVEHDPDMTAEAIVRSVKSALSVFPPDVAAKLEPHVLAMVPAFNMENAAVLKLLQDAGVLAFPLSDESLNYMAHIVRPQAERQLRELGGGDIIAGIRRVVSAADPALKQRGLKGPLTIINDLSESGGLAIAGFKPIPGGLFEENPFVATMLRVGNGAKSAESARMLQDYARVYGTTDAGKAFQQGMVKVSAPMVPAMDNVYFPRDIAAALQSHVQNVVQPNYFLRYWDGAQRVWKLYTLGIFPAYHTRNEIGELYNTIILGGMNPKWLAHSAKTMSAGTTLGDALKIDPEHTLEIGGRTVRGADVLAMGDKFGVTNAGQMLDAADRIGAMRIMPLSVMEAAGHAVSHNTAINMAFKVGQFRQDTMRLAFFMDRLDKGMAPEQAAMEVKKYLFDYQQLTPFERDVVRRFFPFYSWTRNNLPLQVEALLKKPGALAGVEKLRNEAAGPGGNLGLSNGAPLPRFLEEGTPIHMGTQPEGTEGFARLGGFLPSSDVELAMDPKAVLQRMAALLSPFIKSPLESGTNIDTFRSDLGTGNIQPVERFPGEVENLFGLPVNKRFVGHTLENARPITELNRLNPGGLFGSQSAPGLFGAGTIRDRADADPVTRALNLITSRVYPINAEDEQSWAQHDQGTKVRELMHNYTRALSRGDSANAEILRRQIDAMTNADAGVP